MSDQREVLSRNRIVEAAIVFVDADVLAALTMRRLGQELGVEAMSLYRDVNGRGDLLEGIVEHLVEQIHDRPDHDRLRHDGDCRATCSGSPTESARSPGSIPPITVGREA